jgi:arylformamidase
MAIVAFYEDTSARARQELRCQLDVPYGPTRAEHLDIFSAEQRNAPILIFLHGGYWSSLSSKEYGSLAHGPALAVVTSTLAGSNASYAADLAG